MNDVGSLSGEGGAGAEATHPGCQLSARALGFYGEA